MKKIAIVLVFLLPLAVLFASEPMRWVQSETEHFIFIFEPSSQAAVDELTGFCEDVYDKVTGFLDSYPKKIPCVVTDRVDYANGFTTVMPARLILIVAAPYSAEFITPAESWLKFLLTHELTHFVHLSMSGGIFSTLSSVFGGDVAFGNSVFLPGWMTEGITTELETRFTQGGRGRSAFFEMQYKAPILEEKLFSLDQAAYGSPFPPSGRSYVAGYMLTDYLMSTYGQDVFTRIMKRYIDFPFFGPWGAIKEVTGKDAQDIFADMKNALGERFSASAAIPGGALLSPDRIGDFMMPRGTSAGLYIYRNDLERYPAISALDPETRTEKDLLSVSLTDPSSYSPTADGKTVYFTTMEYDGMNPIQEEAVSDLYALDAGSSAVRRITRGAHLRQPAVSPDGGRIAAVQRSGSYGRLVSVDPVSGAQKILFSATETDIYNPSFSPDGSRIAFILNRRGFLDVYILDAARAFENAESAADRRAPVMDVNSDLARPVMGPDPFGEFFPSFLDDRRILFSSDRSGSLALYTANLDDGSVALLWKDPVGAFCGVVAGEELIYGSYGSKGFCLKRAAVDIDEPREPITSTAQSYPQPEVGSKSPAAAYIDLPWLSFWIPMPFLGITGPSEYELGFGIGAAGASPLQTWQWSTSTGFLPWSAQPVFNLSAIGRIGIFTIGYGGVLSYACFGDSLGGFYTQDLSNRIFVSFPLISHSAFGASTSFNAIVESGHSLSVDLASPFTIFDSFQIPAETWSSSIYLSASLGFGTAISGGNLDFYNPLEAVISAGDTHLPELLSRTTWGNIAFGAASANLPSFIPHHVLRLGAKTSYGFGSMASRSDRTTAPRGFQDPQAGEAAGRALAAADYLMSLALCDVPLIWGFNFRKAAAGLHAEVLGQWDTSLGQPVLLPAVYAGIEITAQFGYNDSLIPPIGLGVAFRIDPANPASFNAGTDIGIYLFFSFASFWDAASSGAGFPAGGVHNAAAP